MENEIINKPNLIDKTISLIKEKKKLLLVILILIISCSLGIVFLNHQKETNHKQISEKYIKAGIYLSSDDKAKSKDLYTEIVLSKNKFYSLLALNNILEHELEANTDNVLELFKSVENATIEEEQKNLVKFKKALYLIKIEKIEEGNILLKEIISSNSIWKEVALEISKK